MKTENASVKPENERGVVAQTYHELQAIHVLESAGLKYPLTKASPESAVRAIFQAVEIALLNINDLLCRTAGDLNQFDMDGAVVKLSWVRGFSRVLIRLSSLPYELGDQVIVPGNTHKIGITESPAYRAYTDAMQTLEAAVNKQIEIGKLDIEQTIAKDSLESDSFRILHALRTVFHEHLIWAENLAEVAVPVPVPSYEEFVVTDLMTDAVYDTTLKGDTYFMQFRGLHQVPETLGFEVNDRMEVAIRALRAGSITQALEQLHVINTLSTGILESLPVIADNLSTADYHEIRENLGLTSGSHSVVFHYHMFRDLYDQLADSLDGYLEKNYSAGTTDKSLQDVLREVAENRLTDQQAFLVHMLVSECLRFRIFTRNWRSLHLHLPRNNLGGEHTKSLTGSRDAITAVRGLFSSARKRDPLGVYAEARSAGRNNGTPFGEHAIVSAHTPDLDNTILGITGMITKERFQNVQERVGVFAESCPFAPPSKRKV